MVRSGLIVSQLCPPSVVTWTRWLPAYTRSESCGEMWIGNVHWKRSRSSPAAHPSGLSGQTLTFRACPVRSS